MTEGIRIAVAAVGIILLLADFFMYSKRKLIDGIGLGWGIISVVFILLGVVPGLSGWSRVLPKESYPAVFFLGGFMLLSLFRLSMRISILMQKNQELAMQVSLLNQENEQILAALEKLTEKQNG